MYSTSNGSSYYDTVVASRSGYAMKIDFILTIRLSPESRGEMIDSYAKAYQVLRQQVEEQVGKTGSLEIPVKAEDIRWLLASGKWDEPDTKDAKVE